jgi:nucleoside-diphosphate-sugar epimerase
MKKMLITGISGFVGEEIYKYFNNKKYLIYGVDKIYPSFQIDSKNCYFNLPNLSILKKNILKH